MHNVDFSYRLPVGGIDLEGTVRLVDELPDADGYIGFKIDNIDLHEPVRAVTREEQRVLRAVTEWLHAQIYADEDIQHQWDDLMENNVPNPNDGNGTYTTRMGRVA